MCRLSSSWASKRSPMMNSVLPPPISMTRRRPTIIGQGVGDAEIDQAGFLAAGDHGYRVAQ